MKEVKQLKEKGEEFYPLTSAEGVVFEDGSFLSEKEFAEDGKLTIKRNGVVVGTFTANASKNKEINIVVPENGGSGSLSEEDEEVIAAAFNDLNDRVLENASAIETLAGEISEHSGELVGVEHTVNKVSSITSSSDDNQYPSARAVYTAIQNHSAVANDGVLTIQRNQTTLDTFSANSASDKTINIPVPTKTSELTNDNGMLEELDGKVISASLNDLNLRIIHTNNSLEKTSEKKPIVEYTAANIQSWEDANFTIDWDKVYVFPELTSLIINRSDDPDDGYYHETIIYVYSGSNDRLVITGNITTTASNINYWNSFPTGMHKITVDNLGFCEVVSPYQMPS